MRHLSLILAALLAAGPAAAENRGVVVSNQNYRNAPALEGADAAPASEAMKAAGFRTVAGADLASGDLRTALADLLRPDPSPGARVVLLNGRFLHGGSDSWFMGTDAAKPDLVGAGSQGVALSTLMDLLRGASPGAVLLLGSDGKGMEHAGGLEDGLGQLAPPAGVTVISGPAQATTAAASALLRPGTAVGDVLAADRALVMAAGGDAGLVVMPGPGTVTVTGQGAAPDATPDADRDLWADAAARDSAEAYSAYLQRFPAGAYAAAATTRLEALGGSAKSDRDLWADAAAADSIAAYTDYLRRHPAGEFADAAQKRLTDLRLAETTTIPAPAPAPEIQQPRPLPQVAAPRQQASPAQIAESRMNLSRNTRIVIQRRLQALGYATGGADGAFGPRTRSAIRGWQQSNGYAVTGYLTSSQLNVLRDQANAAAPSREAQDRAYWQRTGAHGGERNLRAYLNAYPNGIYARAARNRLAELGGYRDDSADAREDRAWARAREIDSYQSYTTYLQNWPRGEHAAQARERRARLANSGFGAGNYGYGTGGYGTQPGLGYGSGQTGTGIILDTIIRELAK
ncbi:peptidoglycan-binding domain-containing protein [Paracoccus sp. (in: a-proteobacteria)]|uniref:peptidoglycan-binding domain-containing protein n=1 Tax=Paracoccus sp. TaxID=267 RepID=UPI00322028BE